MRSIRVLMLAFVAMLAFSVVGAIGAGSASALLFLTESGKELLFTVKGGEAKLESSSGLAVACKTVLGHGFIVHKSDEARKILLTFHECSSLGQECLSTQSAEKAGLITTLEMDALLVTLLNGKYGLKTLAEGSGKNLAEFTCGTGFLEAKIIVKGSVVGEFTETKAESEESYKKEAKVVFENNPAKAGEAKILDYWTLEGLRTAKLESNSNGGAFTESNEQATGTITSDGGVKLCHKGAICSV